MRVLVTGATGFLGGHVARRLVETGHVATGFGRSAAHGAALERDGVPFVRGDITRPGDVRRAVEGHDAVVHAAALSSPWGRHADFVAANVDGTRRVLEAAREAGVRRLVHVSTPSVYVDGRDRHDVREDEPLPRRFASAYTATKRAAERLVEASGGPEWVILRPRGLFGPGDTTLVPRLLDAHRRGRLPVIGRGDTVLDLTYVTNAADACVLAVTSGAGATGRTYNVTNGEPVALWPFIGRVLARLGLGWMPRRVPYAVAYAAAGAMEALAALRPGRPEPLLTRYTVTLLGRSQTLSIEAARRHLGYAPLVSMDEGLDRLVSSLQRS